MRLVRLTMALVVTALVASANCFASDFGSLREPGFDLLTPAPHQIDIEADDTYQFLVGANTLRRRINSFPASAISSINNGFGCHRAGSERKLFCERLRIAARAGIRFAYAGATSNRI